MQYNELCERVVGLKAPWKVSVVGLRMEESTVTVSHDRSARFVCPECRAPSMDSDRFIAELLSPSSVIGGRCWGGMSRCRLEPEKRVGRMVRQHLWGIVNEIVHRVTTGDL